MSAGNGDRERDLAERRARLLQLLELRLDEALEEETIPSGLAPEFRDPPAEEATAVPAPDSSPGQRVPETPDADRACDQYALWSSLTALSQETKLQGRAFRDLERRVGELLEREAAPPAPPSLLEATIRDLLGILIELRERMARNAHAAEQILSAAPPQKRRSWPWNRRQQEETAAILSATRAMLEGIDLALDGLRDHFDRLGLSEIECAGMEFNPSLMRAVEVVADDRLPDGTVAQVVRAGYTWNGELLRPADVRVARVPSVRQEAGSP